MKIRVMMERNQIRCLPAMAPAQSFGVVEPMAWMRQKRNQRLSRSILGRKEVSDGKGRLGKKYTCAGTAGGRFEIS